MFPTTYLGIIYLSLIVGPLVSTSLTRCPDGYITQRNSCYKFHRVQLSWPEAGDFCRMLDSHLVTLETQEEYTFIAMKAKEISASLTTNNIWIGLTDAVNQGKWVWIHTNNQISYDVWAPGQPNNTPAEDCAGLGKDIGYKIADHWCRDLFNLVCEIELEDDVQTIVG